MTRIITICSGKGGVGKTMLTANLGTALAKMGENVTILDGNLTTPNLGLHLGIPLYPMTLHDVLKGRINITQATYEHENGLRVVPAGISLRDLRGVDARDLPNALLDLIGTSDIVLVDAAAGLGREALSAIESGDEVLVVTNPELPAVTDALKAVKLAEQINASVLGVVVNRISGKMHELSTIDIQNMLSESNILATIPEDRNVARGIAKRTPVVQYNSLSPASIAIQKLAGALTGREVFVREPLMRRLFRLFK